MAKGNDGLPVGEGDDQVSHTVRSTLWKREGNPVDREENWFVHILPAQWLLWRRLEALGGRNPGPLQQTAETTTPDGRVHRGLGVLGTVVVQASATEENLNWI